MRNKNKDNYFQKNNTVITGESRSKAKEKTSEEIEKETAYFFEMAERSNILAVQILYQVAGKFVSQVY